MYGFGETMNKKEFLRNFYGSKIDNESDDFIEYIYEKLQPRESNILDLHDAVGNYYVNSPDGFVKVNKLISKGTYDIYGVEFEDGTITYGSHYHMYENIYGGYISIANLTIGQKILSNDSFKVVKRIFDTGEKDLVFDLVIDSENHRYYTDGVVSHNSGAGKSIFLQNLAVSWALAGLNVVYLSLELSEKLCAMRIDAMHTGYETREVIKNIDDVHMKIRASQQKSQGSLRIKQLPNGCTANDIRAYIKEYEIHSSKKVDGILVDYLDLMFPASKKISAENLFVKDKYVTEELRNLAVELDILCVSASQLNRGSYEEIEFDPSHIAGGISKVNTADNVIGIFTSAAMKESGRYQIQFMKTRSSSGVGSKVDLAFNNKSLRITDLEEGDESALASTSKNIYEQLKKKSVVISGDKQAPVTSPATTTTTRKVDALEGATALRNFIKRTS